MKKIKSFAFITMTLILLTSCGGKSALVGKWESDYARFNELEFFSDGTYTSDDPNHAGGYSVDGDRLKLNGLLAEDRVYTFKVSGNKLTLYSSKDDKGTEYKKVKD